MAVLRIIKETLNDIFTIRNEANTADAAFKRLFGKQDAGAVERRLHKYASGEGKVCFECRAEFRPGKPVYRARTYTTGGGIFRSWSVWLLSYCESCAPYREYQEGTCKTCDRDVYFPWDRVHRRHVFCSEKCSKSYYVKVQREKRQAAMQRKCVGCSESFKARRRDTKFCSAACKQRAYRTSLKARK